MFQGFLQIFPSMNWDSKDRYTRNIRMLTGDQCNWDFSNQTLSNRVSIVLPVAPNNMVSWKKTKWKLYIYTHVDWTSQEGEFKHETSGCLPICQNEKMECNHKQCLTWNGKPLATLRVLSTNKMAMSNNQEGDCNHQTCKMLSNSITILTNIEILGSKEYVWVTNHHHKTRKIGAPGPSPQPWAAPSAASPVVDCPIFHPTFVASLDSIGTIPLCGYWSTKLLMSSTIEILPPATGAMEDHGRGACAMVAGRCPHCSKLKTKQRPRGCGFFRGSRGSQPGPQLP